MDEALLNPLNRLETSLTALLNSLTTTNTYAAAPAATQSLLDADETLSTALVQLRKHQENYTRILALRVEADRLHVQLKDTVRTCVELRDEIGQIHPSILEDTEDEDDTAMSEDAEANTKRKPRPVDYNTLLGFAARIGKHNAAAAIEAERQSNRRRDEGDDKSPMAPNGSSTRPGQADESAIEIEKAGIATQESLAELAAINDTLAQQRAYRGMAFPAAEALRMGELGRLQYLREQEGEEAVEREIERMIRDTEQVIALEPKSEKVEEDEKPVPIKTEPAPAPSQRAVPQPLPPRPQAHPSLPPKPKKALDLDFPGSDDDDDDDD